jgi:hypothetical protein
MKNAKIYEILSKYYRIGLDKNSKSYPKDIINKILDNIKAENKIT